MRITDQCYITPSRKNSLELRFIGALNKRFIAVIYLTRRDSPKDIISRLERKTREQVLELLKSRKKQVQVVESDDEIVTVQNRMTLKDPLSQLRIGTAARASNCEHLQCFDLENYLEMNRLSPSWTCPICSKMCFFETLFIDGFFMDILQNTPKNCESVTLADDFSWSVEKIEEDDSSDEDEKGVVVTKKEPVEMIILDDDDDDVVNTVVPPARQIKRKTPPADTNVARRPSKRPDTEIIDLTLSSDEVNSETPPINNDFELINGQWKRKSQKETTPPAPKKTLAPMPDSDDAEDFCWDSRFYNSDNAEDRNRGSLIDDILGTSPNANSVSSADILRAADSDRGSAEPSSSPALDILRPPLSTTSQSAASKEKRIPDKPEPPRNDSGLHADYRPTVWPGWEWSDRTAAPTKPPIPSSVYLQANGNAAPRTPASRHVNSLDTAQHNRARASITPPRPAGSSVPANSGSRTPSPGLSALFYQSPAITASITPTSMPVYSSVSQAPSTPVYSSAAPVVSATSMPVFASTPAASMPVYSPSFPPPDMRLPPMTAVRNTMPTYVKHPVNSLGSQASNAFSAGSQAVPELFLQNAPSGYGINLNDESASSGGVPRPTSTTNWKQ